MRGLEWGWIGIGGRSRGVKLELDWGLIGGEGRREEGVRLGLIRFIDRLDWINVIIRVE